MKKYKNLVMLGITLIIIVFIVYGLYNRPHQQRYPSFILDNTEYMVTYEKTSDLKVLKQIATIETNVKRQPSKNLEAYEVPIGTPIYKFTDLRGRLEKEEDILVIKLNDEYFICRRLIRSK